MSRTRVVISGIGLATPLGDRLDHFGDALMEGEGRFELTRSRHGTVVPAARVGSDMAADAGSDRIAERTGQLALAAAARALRDAGLQAGHPLLRQAGVYLGCGSGPSHAVNDAYSALHDSGRLPGLTLLRCLPNGPAGSIAMRWGLRGASRTFTAACASSTQALGEALRAVRHGHLPLVLAGGTEAPLGDGNLKAWDMLRVLAGPGTDPATACRPFDATRCGLVLGEGAALFVIEPLESALARGAPIHAELLGYGESCDAHHWTEPDRDGQIDAMRATLDDAGLEPAEVMAVNAHGTGTVVGDAVEVESLTHVFGCGADGPGVSSTKASHGHLLGASGAVELAAAVVTAQRAQVPPTRNLRQRGDGGRLNLVAGRAARARSGRAVLSNSFAFGGINACLAVAAFGRS